VRATKAINTPLPVGVGVRRRRRQPTVHSVPCIRADSAAAEDCATAAAEEATGVDKVLVEKRHLAAPVQRLRRRAQNLRVHQRKMLKIPELANLSAEHKKSDTKVEIWKKMCSQHGERMYLHEENLQTANHLILDKCSNKFKSKLEALLAWESISDKNNVLALL
jgi:hypothetical protein